MKTIYCPNCGDPSPLGQKFCEKCGTPLPQAVNAPPNQNPAMMNSYPPQTQHSRGQLLDPNRLNYVVQEKFWDLGSGPILDEHGAQIGKMVRKIFSIREKIEIREMNDLVVASIQRKLIAIKPTYTLLDAQGNIIAKLEKTLLSIINPKFYLKDPMGRIVFTAQGKFMGFDFKIYRGEMVDESHVIAEIHKADRWKDIFFGGLWDYKDTYGVRLHDPNVDRRSILGFVIAIDNVLHDSK